MNLKQFKKKKITIINIFIIGKYMKINMHLSLKKKKKKCL